ncbi:MAG: ATP-binding protein [Sphingomonas bacterium]|nr:ATP-binding protein [Sphingomonas bacterium]
MIDLDGLNRLISEKTAESIDLEFKQVLPDDRDGSRKEFLADVVAMANASGGTIIYGLGQDAEGRAAELRPLTGSPDVEQTRIRDMIRSSIEPPLNVRVEVLDVEGGFVLLVGIDFQFNGPYRTTYQGSRKFTIRDGTSKAEMTYQQLRNAFGKRDRIFEEIKHVHVERLADLRQLIALRRFEDKPWLFLHVFPLIAFSDNRQVDLHAVAKRGYTFSDRYTGHDFFSLDGLKFTLAPSPPYNEYVQFLRNGAVEVAWNFAAGNTNRKLAATRIATKLRSSIAPVVSELVAQGLTGPAVFQLSFLNCESSTLVVEINGWADDVGTVDDKEAVMPGVLIERLEDPLPTIVDPLAQALLDVLWQVFGQSKCDYYIKGRWIG